MMQSTGFGPPQNQMQPYVKPLRYPNLLHWSNKIFLTLNFHHTNEKGTKVLKMYDIRTGQVTACFQALLLCFLCTLLLAGVACYRSLTKQRRTGRERAPKKSRSEVEQDAASSIRRLFEGSPPPSSDDDYPDDDFSKVSSTRAPSIKCINLTTSYGGGSTLMDLSCEFEGSTCLMGPSGAGKTSLLNALVGSRATQHRARLCDDRRRRTQFKGSAIDTSRRYVASRLDRRTNFSVCFTAI